MTAARESPSRRSEPVANLSGFIAAVTRVWHQTARPVLCILAIACLSSRAAALDVIVVGDLTDATTGQPIVGAPVEVRFSALPVGRALSDERGRFRVPATLPDGSNLYVAQLAIDHPDYAAKTEEIQVVNKEPTRDSYALTLFPRVLAPCLPQRGHGTHLVVVGHFRSPIGENIGDLSDRLAEAMQFDLLNHLQRAHVPTNLQPIFAPCTEAKPRAISQGKTLAQALRADALVHGNVSREQNSFHVSTHVSDAHNPAAAPVTATSRDVDLNNPNIASMNPDTHVAVLAAVAAGLLENRDCVGALAVASAAERLAGQPPPFVAGVRQRCVEAPP